MRSSRAWNCDAANAAISEELLLEDRAVSLDPYALPPDLPVPEDDGAADHLPGTGIPALVLESSQGPVDLAELCAERAVLEDQIEFAERNHLPYPVLAGRRSRSPGTRCTSGSP